MTGNDLYQLSMVMTGGWFIIAISTLLKRSENAQIRGSLGPKVLNQVKCQTPQAGFWSENQRT